MLNHIDDVNKWHMGLLKHQIPTAYKDIYKEFKILGAFVSVKRHQPSPIAFGNANNTAKSNYAQVAHQELWWYPSGGDKPEVIPRLLRKAIIVGDNWTTRYIPFLVPVATQLRSWDATDTGVFEVWSRKGCPWMPVDHFDSSIEDKNVIPQQSLGYFFVDQNYLQIDVQFDIEVRFKVAFRYRKDLVMNDQNPDTSGAVDKSSGAFSDLYPG